MKEINFGNYLLVKWNFYMRAQLEKKKIWIRAGSFIRYFIKYNGPLRLIQEGHVTAVYALIHFYITTVFGVANCFPCDVGSTFCGRIKNLTHCTQPNPTCPNKDFYVNQRYSNLYAYPYYHNVCKITSDPYTNHH